MNKELITAERVRLITNIDIAIRKLAEFEDQVVRAPYEDTDYLRAFDQHEAWLMVDTRVAIDVALKVERASQLPMFGDLEVYDVDNGTTIRYDQLSLLSFHSDDAEEVSELVEAQLEYYRNE